MGPVGIVAGQPFFASRPEQMERGIDPKTPLHHLRPSRRIQLLNRRRQRQLLADRIKRNTRIKLSRMVLSFFISDYFFRHVIHLNHWPEF